MQLSDQLVSFAEDLCVLLNAGSTVDSSLQFMLNSKSASSKIPALAQIHTQVRQGVLLSSALAEHAEYFDNYFIGMVRSGEASGQLARALGQLAAQLERQQELRNQINNALVYPTILIVVMALSLMLVLGVILPKLTSLFESFGGELSLAAQTLLSVGQFINAWGQTVLIVIAISVLLLYLLQDQLKTKQRITALLLRAPFIRSLLSQIEFARFTSTLSSLLGSGLAQTDALAIAAESFQFAHNRKQIKVAISRLKEGESLSRAMAHVEGLGDLYAHSIASGERAGQLSATLNILAQRLDKDFSRRAQRLALLIEPVLIIVLGSIIGLIIYTVFSVMQSVGDLPL